MLNSNNKNRVIIIRGLTFMLMIMVFIVIFFFSSENASESKGTSNKVINFIINVNPYTKNLSNEEKEQISEKIITPIRKLAHFSIYTTLGITAMSHVCTYKMSKKKQIAITLVIGILYAMSDEIHQSFVPGRSCELRDVCIDSLGVLFGILIVIVMRELISKKYSNK